VPDHRRTYCRESKGGCGKSSDEVGPISWYGLCETCGRDHINVNLDQMEARSGPNWSLWRARMAACVGGVLLDDVNAGR
jgi:hypothetical protein